MTVSIFDLFSLGIGPSSSHTVGPMRAALTFVRGLTKAGQLDQTHSITAELYGSLAATGRGHGSDRAVVMGLMGLEPETVDPRAGQAAVDAACREHRLTLDGIREVDFKLDDHVRLMLGQSLPLHPNGMTFIARDAQGAELARASYYSIGGGFIVDEQAHGPDRIVEHRREVPHPFRTAQELLAICQATGKSIAGIALDNESAFRPEQEVRDGLLIIAQAMQDCVEAGLQTEGMLPGILRVRRRAPELMQRLVHQQAGDDQLRGMDWLTVFALAVNEENAGGGRVVTAPTNGAAGVIPAVLQYYKRFVPGASDAGVIRFLLTAGAIGTIYLETASISGAEVGCQGEVGSACSMAAAGYAAVLGGSPAQVENAAEIGMEHNLGLTCDPVGGLVQIPCIERNAVAAVQAVTAARTALLGDGNHIVSLDQVIKTMRDTGADMKSKYKETSEGGLAVNVIEC